MANISDFELTTLPGLFRWYAQSARQMAYQAHSRAEAEYWQDTLRVKLWQLLGDMPAEKPPNDPQTLEVFESAHFRREFIVIQTQADEYMPCYVLVPRHTKPPYKPVIALHGHGSWGARGLVGIATSDIEREFIKLHNYDYAQQLAQRGYLVFAPVMRGFAERSEPAFAQSHDSNPDARMWISSCKQLSLDALLCGKTLLGLRVWDVMRLIDYIKTRPEPMIQGLGCVGLSGGATITLFAAALDSRISSAVVSGYFSTFRESIMSIDHCVCNYIPGIVKYAEMVDIAGLIAPRPLLIETGRHDPIFPTEAAQRAFVELQPIYQRFDAPANLTLDQFDGGHQWSGQKAYDWLGSHLS
jgi:dienelactone hydrolase